MILSQKKKAFRCILKKTTGRLFYGITNPQKGSVEKALCVACGCCGKVCPMAAISVYKGLYAQVDTEKCVGCGKCAKECPASVITMKEAAQ